MSEAKAGRRSLRLNSTMESVAQVEAAAVKLAAEAGLDDDERFHVAMAAREAAVNAVLHGNEYDPAKQISASFENTGAALVITVADIQGKILSRKSVSAMGAGLVPLTVKSSGALIISVECNGNKVITQKVVAVNR